MLNLLYKEFFDIFRIWKLFVIILFVFGNIKFLIESFLEEDELIFCKIFCSRMLGLIESFFIKSINISLDGCFAQSLIVRVNPLRGVTNASITFAK